MGETEEIEEMGETEEIEEIEGNTTMYLVCYCLLNGFNSLRKM